MDMVWGQRKGLAEVLNKLRYTNCNYLAISVSENIKSFSESIFACSYNDIEVSIEFARLNLLEELCLFSNATHLFLTATATDTSIENLGKILQYLNLVKRKKGTFPCDYS